MEEGCSCAILQLVGGGTLLYWVLSLVWYCAQLFKYYVWARMVKGEPWTTRFGQWAVVTGASDGIGEAYVHKLAERDMNVILIARNKEKLDKVAQTVRSKYGIETLVVVADFGDGQPIYENIAKELKEKDIGVLVNNVGSCVEFHTNISEWKVESMWDIVNINVMSVSVITKIVLPGMLQRHRGAIINIGSLTSVMACPGTAMYSATKAFVSFFTQALSVECEGTGVLVQGVHPGLVYSNLTQPVIVKGNYNLEFLCCTADVYAESALSTVGYTDYTFGYWRHDLHRIIFGIMEALPFKIGYRSILKKSYVTRDLMDKAM